MSEHATPRNDRAVGQAGITRCLDIHAHHVGQPLVERINADGEKHDVKIVKGEDGATRIAVGGRLTGIAGEKICAVFGAQTDACTASRQAIAALAAIELALERLNARLEGEWGHTAVVALSLHAGPAAIGAIGGGDAPAWAVAGGAADVADRIAMELRRRARDPHQPRIAISDAVLEAAGIGPVDAVGEFPDGVRVFRSVKSLADGSAATR